MIRKTSNALEYLFLNDSGDFNVLKKKISADQIELFKRSDALVIKDGKYKLTEKGKEAYVSEYFSDKDSSLALFR